jgi:hypothetical protein
MSFRRPHRLLTLDAVAGPHVSGRGQNPFLHAAPRAAASLPGGPVPPPPSPRRIFSRERAPRGGGGGSSAGDAGEKGGEWCGGHPEACAAWCESEQATDAPWRPATDAGGPAIGAGMASLPPRRPLLPRPRLEQRVVGDIDVVLADVRDRWGRGATRATRGRRACGRRHGGGWPLLCDSCVTGIGSPHRRGPLLRCGGRPAPWTTRMGGREGTGAGCG